MFGHELAVFQRVYCRSRRKLIQIRENAADWKIVEQLLRWIWTVTLLPVWRYQSLIMGQNRQNCLHKVSRHRSWKHYVLRGGGVGGLRGRQSATPNDSWLMASSKLTVVWSGSSSHLTSLTFQLDLHVSLSWTLDISLRVFPNLGGHDWPGNEILSWLAWAL